MTLLSGLLAQTSITEVTIDAKTAIGALVTVGIAVSATLLAWQRMLVSLDDKWQHRIAEVDKGIRSDLKEVNDKLEEAKLPLLEHRVQHLEVRVRRLEDEGVSDNRVQRSPFHPSDD